MTCRGLQCRNYGRCDHEPDELGDCYEPAKSTALIAVSRLYGHSKVRVRYDLEASQFDDIKKLCKAIDAQTQARMAAANRDYARQLYWLGREMERELFA